MAAVNFYSLLRILLGAFFIVSGFEKIISPYQNFLYVVQSYEIFGSPLDVFVARIVPWVELFTGVFLLLGLWTRFALRAMLLLLAGFITIVGQALIRHLPIQECGCFGELISLPLQVVILFDSALFLFGIIMYHEAGKAGQWGLDNYFQRNEST